MFKNRELRVQMVKPSERYQDAIAPRCNHNLESWNHTAKDFVKNAGVVFVSAYGAKVLLDTVSKIAVKKFR